MFHGATSSEFHTVNVYGGVGGTGGVGGSQGGGGGLGEGPRMSYNVQAGHFTVNIGTIQVDFQGRDNTEDILAKLEREAGAHYNAANTPMIEELVARLTSTASDAFQVVIFNVSGGSSNSTTANTATGEVHDLVNNRPAEDVHSVLHNLNRQTGGSLNWQSSIVDLLKLLGMNHSLDARKALADELDVHAGAHGSFRQNVALHQAVLGRLTVHDLVRPADAQDVPVSAVLVNHSLNWQTSIVDLLKKHNLNSSLDARKALVDKLNVRAGAHGSAEQNIALYEAVTRWLAENH